MRAGFIRALCCSVAAVWFVAPFARGEAMRAGEATFTPPEAWSVKSQADGLVRIVAPDDNAMILVMPAPEFEGDLGEGFEKTWAALRQSLKIQKVLTGGEPESRVNGKGYETVRTEATVRDASGNRLAFRYVIARNGKAVCGVAFLGTPQAFEEHADVYARFSAGFSLGGGKGAPRGKTVPAVPEKPAPDEDKPVGDVTAAGERAGDEPADDVERAGKAAPAKKGRPAPEPPGLEPGTVAGRIADARGNVIEDARLYVQVAGTTLAGERTSFDIEVDEDGRFSQEVPDGLWRIYGFVEKEHDGHKYRLPLDPEDQREIGATQGTRKGVVKNFVWRVAGLKPKADKTLAGSYYGGSVAVADVQLNPGRRLADRHPGAKVVITLKPRGPLLDGSPAKPVNLEADVAALAAFTRPTFFNIPLGEYVATARLVGPGGGGGAPLNVAVGFVPVGGGRPARAAPLAFVPASAVETLGTLSLSVWE